MKEKSWKEFADSGLLWWINMLLHTFGWSIVTEYENGTIKNVYPARVKYRGFQESINTDGYIKISRYMDENSKQLLEEAKE